MNAHACKQGESRPQSSLLIQGGVRRGVSGRNPVLLFFILPSLMLHRRWKLHVPVEAFIATRTVDSRYLEVEGTL